MASTKNCRDVVPCGTTEVKSEEVPTAVEALSGHPLRGTVRSIFWDGTCHGMFTE